MLVKIMGMVSHTGQPSGAGGSLSKSYSEQMSVSLLSRHTILG